MTDFNEQRRRQLVSIAEQKEKLAEEIKAMEKEKRGRWKKEKEESRTPRINWRNCSDSQI